jgi:hypothetical protein
MAKHAASAPFPIQDQSTSTAISAKSTSTSMTGFPPSCSVFDMSWDLQKLPAAGLPTPALSVTRRGPFPFDRRWLGAGELRSERLSAHRLVH